MNTNRHISKFTELLPLTDHHIVALDIDETTLYYDTINSKWWKNAFNKYYSLLNDYEHADTESLKHWENTIAEKDPIHTDQEGFNELVNSNVQIIFVTARNKIMSDITKIHMAKIGIHDPEIIFCAHENKGILLKEWLINNNSFDKNLIYVDDKEYNITDVKTYIPHAKCFKFVIT